MTKTVIFGGSGFIGSALRKLLPDAIAPTKQEIHLSAPGAHNSINAVVNDGDTVIMIATRISTFAYGGRGWDYTDAAQNIAMGSNMAMAMRTCTNSHFVYVSSDSVYGDLDLGGVMHEDSPIRPKNLYGHMHAMRELFFKEVVPPERLTIIRPCAVYGVGDPHNSYGINRFIRSAMESGEIALFGNGEECRSNIHVSDVASVIAQAAIGKISGVYNANCGWSYSFMRIAQIIQSNMDKEISIVSKPRTLPIRHRYVDNKALVERFFQPRWAEDGIQQILQSL